MRKLWLGAAVLLLSTVVALGPAPAIAAGPPETAGQALPGQFIVTLADSADARAVAAEYRRGGAEIDFVYTAALNGFAGKMSDSQVSQARRDGRVLRVEQDQVVTADATETQSDATWGLDRSDQRELPLDQAYTNNATGAGVTAYIIDTGIFAGHTDFGGRVSTGYTTIDDGKGTDDCHGHGTHVAGTVGSTTYGVAKGVKLAPVRVLDCTGSGTWAGVIAGVDWVTDNAVKPAVANMSLGGGASDSVDAAVDGAINGGVTVAVAAGNGNMVGIAQDACKSSPARVPAAITIGATTETDAKTSWSNYGSCVDWFAPGLDITSTWIGANAPTKTISGTSMATPHVAGAAALYLEGAKTASPATVRAALYDMTTKGIVTSSKTANNHLLYTLAIGEPATTTGTLNGTVTSSGGDLLSGATVTAGELSTTTDTTGAYSLTLAGGTYTVTASATGHDPASASVTVTNGETTTVKLTLTKQATSTGISLSASGYKVKGLQKVDLKWSGASTAVDVYRGSSKIVTGTANDGAHTDHINKKGGGSYTYKVCEADTATCSNEVTVTF